MADRQIYMYSMYLNHLIMIFVILLLISSSGLYLRSSSIYATVPEVPDDKGVIMYNYNGVQRKVYNPLFVTSGGLKYYSEFENHGDKQSKQYFINTADWLVNNAKDKDGGKYSIWEYSFPWSSYGWISPPYYSGLAQAQGLKVLILAYNLTGDEKYLNEANNTLHSFLIDYDKGGVVSNEEEDDGGIGDGDSSTFIHLLAKPGLKKIYALNGHTQSILLLWDYYQRTQDPIAKTIFDNGIKWLRENLWKYDTGGWSYYDLMENLASTDYHKAQITQLRNLYEITGESVLKEYSDRFDKYKRSQPLD
jgi:heparosan-N-sulfate-glucuronate 5-epimerase